MFELSGQPKVLALAVANLSCCNEARFDLSSPSLRTLHMCSGVPQFLTSTMVTGQRMATIESAQDASLMSRNRFMMIYVDSLLAVNGEWSYCKNTNNI